MQRRLTFTIDETAFAQLAELATRERRSARDEGAYLLEQALRQQSVGRMDLRSIPPRPNAA